MLTPKAATAPAVRPKGDHNWFGFVESASCRTNSSVRPSIQFLRGDAPTAKVTVWAFLVSNRAMTHSGLMDRDSWMPFRHCIYVTLSPPNEYPENCLLGC